MILNHEEIKRHKIIEESIDSCFTNSSYNLTVGTIVAPGGKTVDKYVIKPNGTVIIVSNEILRIPKGIMGYATVKTRLSKKGIMANNIGIVDSMYQGPLSSVLVNYGCNEYSIEKGDEFLRMIFHKFNEPIESLALSWPGPFSKEQYLLDIIKDSQKRFGESFIDVDTAAKEAKRLIKKERERTNKRIFKSVAITVAIIGAALVLFNTTWDLRGKKFNSLLNDLQSIKSQVDDYGSTQAQILDILTGLGKGQHTIVTDDTTSVGQKQFR